MIAIHFLRGDVNKFNRVLKRVNEYDILAWHHFIPHILKNDLHQLESHTHILKNDPHQLESHTHILKNDLHQLESHSHILKNDLHQL
jgi:hypothetical protein